MKKQLILLAILVTGVVSYAQQIPVGSCGIVHIYDASGNRTKRLYYCNNGGTYPSRPANPIVTTEEIKTAAFQEVPALYPNPTSGIFQIIFSRELKNAVISIFDVNGKLFKQFKASGQKLTCNISNLAAGEYFVKINDKGTVITKKVIKQ
jgi:hypothetical protein